MKRVMLAVKAAMVALVLAASVAGPSLAASAATAANFTNRGEPGTCLDANSNDYPKNGDNIQLWDCNTHPEQEWTLTASGQVKNASTGMCLDANSNDYPKNGDNIQLWDCNTHPEQEWTLTASGQVKNASTGMCLDANSNDYPKNGDNIQLWDCNTHPEQEWILGGPSGPYNAGIIAKANAVSTGTSGGQCLVWVGNIVKAAGGPTIAFGYDPSTYQAHWAAIANQVSWSNVEPGDIVQFVTSSNEHTLIITGGNSPSTATVVDSNFGLTGLVSRGSFASRAAGFNNANYIIWRIHG